MIDTHVHIIRPDLFAYPWIESIDALQRSFTIEAYCDRAVAIGITKAVLMEVDVDVSDQRAEARHFRQCSMADHPLDIRYVASGRPELDDFERHLDAIDDPLLAGVRRVFHVAPAEAIHSAALAGNLRLLGRRGLVFDLCVRPDQLADATRLVDGAPDTQFVLDHCGNPPVATDAYPLWKSDLLVLAERPNVCVKVSGLVNNLPPEGGAIDQLRPVLDHTVRAFGLDRMMFGGDWPVSLLAGYELADWVAIFRDLTAEWNEQPRDTVYSDVAERVYFSRDWKG